jgi:hypothetical protein
MSIVYKKKYLTSREIYTAESTDFSANVEIHVILDGPLDIKFFIGDDNDFFFSNQSTRYCKLYLEHLEAGNSPRGYVRKMMSHLLLYILKEHPDIGPQDGIYLLACGYTRHKFLEKDLIQFYEKIGFQIIAEKKNNSVCHTYLSAPIKRILINL